METLWKRTSLCSLLFSLNIFGTFGQYHGAADQHLIGEEAYLIINDRPEMNSGYQQHRPSLNINPDNPNGLPGALVFGCPNKLLPKDSEELAFDISIEPAVSLVIESPSQLLTQLDGSNTQKYLPMAYRNNVVPLAGPTNNFINPMCSSALTDYPVTLVAKLPLNPSCNPCSFSKYPMDTCPIVLECMSNMPKPCTSSSPTLYPSVSCPATYSSMPLVRKCGPTTCNISPVISLSKPKKASRKSKSKLLSMVMFVLMNKI